MTVIACKKRIKMRFILIVHTLVLATFAFANDELPMAESCDTIVCQLPDCRCSNLEIPGGLAARDTPQFVLLTFDDEVNDQNIVTYRSLLYNRVNKNNCPVGVTFFISHEHTDYSLVNELYNEGFEVALHSISHLVDVAYWRNASPEMLMREFGDQKTQMAHFANIPEDRINGIRCPFLHMAGNATFEMLATAGLRYDLSWPTSSFLEPGLWPYTLHYESIQDCFIHPCPTASIPGPWVIPMISWTDLEGRTCPMADTCVFNPEPDDEDGWFKFILINFERHYLGNRAPFGIYIHEVFFNTNPGLYRAIDRFLDMVNNLNDAFMVNANDVIDWVQNPIPINEYLAQDCRISPATTCNTTSCDGISSEDTGEIYWMQVCSSCPRTYPWVGNPLGE